MFRHKSNAGDFELDQLQLEDVLVTVYQPGNFRPYQSSIFRADIRTFRKRWMFYDFLCAENVVGQFDNCLFSLHKPQSIGRTTEKDLEHGDWGMMVRPGFSSIHSRSAGGLINPRYRPVSGLMVFQLTTSKTLQQAKAPSPGSPLEKSTPFLISSSPEKKTLSL
jgi:Yeast mitochondrial distribution and morphology (MDM) proteins